MVTLNREVERVVTKGGFGLSGNKDKFVSDSILTDSKCTLYATIGCNSTFNQSLTCADLYCFKEQLAVATKEEFAYNSRLNKYTKGFSNISLLANDGNLSNSAITTINLEQSQHFVGYPIYQKPLQDLQYQLLPRQRVFDQDLKHKFTQSASELESKAVENKSLVICIRLFESTPEMRNCYELQPNPSLERQFLKEPSSISLRLESPTSRREHECNDFYEGFLNNPTLYTELLGSQPDESVLAGLQTVVNMVQNDQSNKTQRQRPYLRSRSPSPERFCNRNVILAPAQPEKSTKSNMDSKPNKMKSSNHISIQNILDEENDADYIDVSNVQKELPTTQIVPPVASKWSPQASPDYGDDDLSLKQYYELQDKLLKETSLPKNGTLCSTYNRMNDKDVYTCLKRSSTKTKSRQKKSKKRKPSIIISYCDNSLSNEDKNTSTRDQTCSTRRSILDNPQYKPNNESDIKHNSNDNPNFSYNQCNNESGIKRNSIDNASYSFSRSINESDIKRNSNDNPDYRSSRPNNELISSRQSFHKLECCCARANSTRNSFDNPNYCYTRDNSTDNRNCCCTQLGSRNTLNDPNYCCARSNVVIPTQRNTIENSDYPKKQHNLSQQNFLTNSLEPSPTNEDKNTKGTSAPIKKGNKKVSCSLTRRKPSKSVSAKDAGDGSSKQTAPTVFPSTTENMPCETRYATTVVSIYPSYTIYEVLKSSHKKPSGLNKQTEGIFVVKK